MMIVISYSQFRSSHDQLRIIFDFFSQVDETNADQFAGVGIGVQITEKNVQLMKGDILVESELDQAQILNSFSREDFYKHFNVSIWYTTSWFFV